MQALYYGGLTVGDMHSNFGYQKQAPVHLTDFLYAVPGEAYDTLTSFMIDSLHECINAKPIFIPANQQITQAGLTVTDNDASMLAGIPAVKWTSFAVTERGTGLPMDATKYGVQEFAERTWRNQFWDLQILDQSKAAVAKVVARASTVVYEGVDTPMAIQSATILISRNMFAGLSASQLSQVTLRVNVAGVIYAVLISTADFPSLLKSLDGGVTYSEVKSTLKTDSSPVGQMGAHNPGKTSDMIPVYLNLMNGKLAISVGGVTVPFLAPLGGFFSTGVVSASHGQVKVREGDGIYFPPAPFTCQTWPGSAAPSAANVTTVTVFAVDGDTFTVSGDVRVGANLAILDPRINYIEVEGNIFTQFGCAIHPTQFAAQPALTGPPNQVGFIPDASTPFKYSVLTGIETIDVASGVVTPIHFPPNATVTVTTAPEIVGTTLSQYDLEMKNPPKSGGGYASYGGISYAHETACIARVVSRVDGIVDPPNAANVTIPMGFGGKIELKAVSENISFDPSAMTIRHTVNATMSNFRGINYLSSKWGFAGAGNIAAGLALGWKHQGGPTYYGHQRFYGFCPEFTYPRQAGGTAYITLSCTDQMQQLAECFLAAPPNLDGMNHYFAMALLASMAGIPLTQMAFAAYVPADPYGYVSIDPAPYGLPLGLGSHPWTPVNRTLPVLELMDSIRKFSGFLLYFDAYGMLRYEEWIPETSGFPKRTFTETATGRGVDFTGGITEMWDLTVVASTRDVRNRVMLIGLDAYGTGGGIRMTREDTASISSPPGAQPKNYIGYPKPYVWMDSRFANTAFSLRSIDRMARFLRIPDFSVRFTTWMQPDLFPLDVIFVNDPKSNTYNIPFTIMSMTNNLSKMSKGAPSCSITARYLEPSLLQPY